MIPVTLLLIYGATLLIPGPAVERFLDETLQSYLPAIPTEGTIILNTVRRLISLRSGVGLIGLVGLLWSTVGGFVSLQLILDKILDIRQRRSFIKQYIVGFSMLVILLALTILSSLLTAISPEIIVKMFNVNSSQWIPFVHIAGRIFFPLVLFITCYFSYRVLPSHALSTLALVIGSSVSTICIYVGRWFFVLYTHHLGRYELIYGTLTFVMLFTFWIYISSIIFLFGAEVAANFQKPKRVIVSPSN